MLFNIHFRKLVAGSLFPIGLMREHIIENSFSTIPTENCFVFDVVGFVLQQIIRFLTFSGSKPCLD